MTERMRAMLERLRIGYTLKCGSKYAFWLPDAGEGSEPHRATINALRQRGYIKGRVASGRDGRDGMDIYSITDAGRAALAAS
jgi:hypothetical protein